MLSPEQKEQAMLSHEGQILSVAGNYGANHGADVARAAVDGAMNALVRLEGREAAAKYAFALADRVAGAVLAPTVVAWPRSLEPIMLPPPPEEPPPRWRGWAARLRAVPVGGWIIIIGAALFVLNAWLHQ